MTTRPCPICQRPAEKDWFHPLQVALVECNACGRYEITHGLDDWWKKQRAEHNGALPADDVVLLPYLSAATRQASSPLRLNPDNWKELARPFRNAPLSHKLRRLLGLIAERSSAPGEWVRFDPDLVCPLLAVRDDNELAYLVQHLSDSGHLTRAVIKMPGTEDPQGGHAVAEGYQLTVSGWEAVAPISTGVLGTCFVAMSFDPSLDVVYEQGIVLAVEKDCEFLVIRIDRVPHNENITDRIIAAIRSAQFVVADFTFQRQGVYYEAGFAQGLGRTVIWTCRESDLKDVHFDTRQFNHVVWTTPADLRQKLTDRIRATVPGARLH